MSQPLNPPSSPVPGAIYTEDLTGISWVWTGVAWIEGGPSSNYSAQIKTGMALTPGFYSGLSTTTTGGSGTNLAAIGTQYGATAPVNPSFGQTWIDTSDSLRPVTYVWTEPGSWTKTSDGTTNTYVQSVAPTDHEIGDSWYNTSSSELNIWDGAQWRQIVGTGGGGTAISLQSYATTPPVQTEGSIVYNTTEDKVYVSNGTSWVEMDQAPDVDTHSILAIAAPTVRANGDPLVSGDNWIDTSSNTINYYDGSAWVRLASATVGDTHSFWSASAPLTRPDTTPLVAGDFWVDSNTAAVNVWAGSVWSPVVNAKDNNTNSIVSSAQPIQRTTADDPNLQEGDLWVNSGDFSVHYWTGVTWIPLSAQTSPTGDKHSFTGATTPTLVQRPDGNSLLVGDQWVNTVTSVLYYWSGSSWVAVTAPASSDTHSFTGTGSPIGAVFLRPSDGSALQDGDLFVDDATGTIYYYDLSATAWKQANSGIASDTHSFTGTGAPTLTVRPDTSALLDGDLYIDDANNYVYYYDLSATTWKSIYTGELDTDSHSFTGTGAPALTQRPDTTALQDGDFYVDDATNAAYFYDLSATAWKTISTGAVNTDTHSFTGTGTPTLTQRPDATALQDGDMYVDDATDTIYFYDLSATAWKSTGAASQDLHSFDGAGIPSLTQRPSGDALVNGDQYVDRLTDRLYYYKDSAFVHLTDLQGYIGTVDPNTTSPYNTSQDSQSRAFIDGDSYIKTDTSDHYYFDSSQVAGSKWVLLAGGTPPATSTTLGTVYADTSGPYNTALGYLAGYSLTGTKYGTTLLGTLAGRNITSGQDLTFVGASSGNNAPATSTGITIIGSHDGTGLATGDFVLAPAGSGGSSHTNKYLQFDAGGALGVPATSLSSTVNYGTSGEVLISQGASTPPIWGAAAGSNPEYITGTTTFPTTRVGGSALVSGDIFHETNIDRKYFHTGMIWEPYGTHNHVQGTTPLAAFTRVKDTWVNTATMNQFVYFNDGVSTQWVQIV